MAFSKRLCLLVNSSVTASGDGELLNEYRCIHSFMTALSSHFVASFTTASVGDRISKSFGASVPERLFLSGLEANFYLCVYVYVCMCISVCICMYWLINPLYPECNCSLNSRIATREWFIAASG